MANALIDLSGQMTVPADLTKAAALMQVAEREVRIARSNPSPGDTVPSLMKAVEALTESNKLLFQALFRDQVP